MTSSTQPPSLSQQSGPPASQWAQNTVGAVGGAADHTGGDPHGPNSSSTTSDTPNNSTSAQSGGGYLASAGQAARQYLPTSVVGTLEGAGVLSGSGNQTSNANSNTNTTSLPSQESSFTPSAGGVGSLPGTASEADVAKLPEERALESKIGGTVGREGALGTGVSEGVRSGMNDATPATKSQPPGGPSAAGPTTAAQFLDSSIHPVPSTDGDGTNIHHVVNPNTGSSGRIASHDNDLHEGVDRNKPLPPPGGNTNSIADDAEGDNDTSYVRNQGERLPARPEPNHAYTPPGSSADLTVPGETQTQVHGGKEDAGDVESVDNSNEEGGKPSLKQKIKGEVKVLAGKVSKDPKKVEAGKALKEGNVA